MGPIGVFDSGYGGLTILRELVKALPQTDFVYLGDNARSPYGSRSFDTIHHYTRQAVEKLFALGAPLVIVACNTASARALRNIQQQDLPQIAPDRRVLGVLRPTTEEAGNFTRSGHIGILGTEGTVRSGSYSIEIAHLFPQLKVFQQACPLWAPMVENGEIEGAGVEWFIRRDLERLFAQERKIDSLLLACTHYPLLLPLIERSLPSTVRIVQQGPLVAQKLVDYLSRHPEMVERIAQNGKRSFLTTEVAELFEKRATRFFGEPIKAVRISLGENRPAN